VSLPWTDIPVFLAIARCGALGSAARQLKLDRTTISRRLRNMERSLGRKLFERSDSTLLLTRFGRQVFAAAESAEQELAILDRPGQAVSHAKGRLRVSMSEHLLVTLTGCFKEFAFANREILLELTATDRMVDLHHFEADVVLRIRRGAPGNLESRNVGKPVFSLYRGPQDHTALERYIARPSEKGIPKYLRTILPDAKIIASVNGLVSMREMIARNVGAGILPDYFGNIDTRVERCSEPLPSVGFSLHIAYLPEQRRLHRLKVFVDFVENYLRALPGFETG